MIKLDVCSDLHVDQHFHTTKLWSKDGPRSWYDNAERTPIYFDFKWHRRPGSSVLVLAGDISDEFHHVESCLREAALHYEWVVYVDGNHEHQAFRRENISTTMDHIADLQISIPNLIYLDGEQNCRRDIGATAFIGGNAWYDWRGFESKGVTWLAAMESWEQYSRDQELNFGENHTYPSTYADEQAANIRAAYDQAKASDAIKNIVMVTHTAPHTDCLQWIPDNDRFNVGSASFCNSGLSPILIEQDPKLKLWVYGHTHHRKNFRYGRTTLINNSYGYPRENMGSGIWSMAPFEV